MDAIVQHQDKTLKPTTPRAIVMAEALREDTEQRALLAEYVDNHLVEGTDYGVIPGTPQEVEISVGGKKRKVRKNNLLKPGAEKLFDLFRCRPEYEIISRDVDREAGLYAYEIRCRAVSRETDTVLNEGLGSASSFESKHRYRNTERVCPQCQKPNIRKSKPPREGWYCWDRTGGCGTNFKADDPAILDQDVGKMVNPDLADVANTVLKMAKKRAQVDCAIALARVSDMFTQDLEELAEGEHATSAARPAPRRAESDNTQRAAEAIVEQAQQTEAKTPTSPQAQARGDALWRRLVGTGKGQLGMTATKATFWMTKALKSLKPIKSIDDLTDEQLTQIEQAFSREFGE